jgi:antitoxin component YwqK of YwqJK toxin-antitoxin module
MTGLASAALMVLCFVAGSAHAAVYDCEMNGEHVNPANGSSYAGKTGIMKCVDRDTKKLVRETEYRNGRAIGYRKSIDFQGNTSIGNYNEQGNRDGEAKQYDAEGKLVSEERYANGSTVGVQTYYHKNGQVRRRSFSEPRKGSLASIEYNDQGQLMQLRCADRPLLGDDRGLCGFDGNASDVTFHDAKGGLAGRARFENGKRLSMTALGAGGAVARSEEEAHGGRRVVRAHFPDGALRMETVVVGKMRESERELAKSGQPVRETRWSDGYKSAETLWYLNGQPKSKTRWEREGRDVLVKTDAFWDNGRLRERSVTDGRGNYIGVRQRHAESGQLESESTYEGGKLTRRKTYKDGRLELDEEYFDDGSRKSARKAN